MDIQLKRYINSLKFNELKKMFSELKQDVKQFKQTYKYNNMYKGRILELIYIRNKLRGV